MIATTEAVKILGCTEREFSRAAAIAEERKPWKQFGIPGRFTRYWRSDELDAIREVLSESGFQKVYKE